MACLFGLAPDGVYPATDVATSAVSSYLAISTLPVLLAQPSAVYFLWHFPSPHGVRSLTGILLCGARTFLPALTCAATVWPASRWSLTPLNLKTVIQSTENTEFTEKTIDYHKY